MCYKVAKNVWNKSKPKTAMIGEVCDCI